MAEQRWAKYGDQTMEIPAGMTIEQVKALMARFFPAELADPAVTTEKKGDTTTYVFSKKAGRKGARRRSVFQVIRRLQKVRAAPVVTDQDLALIQGQAPDRRAAGHLHDHVDDLQAETELAERAVQVLLDTPSAAPLTGSIL